MTYLKPRITVLWGLITTHFFCFGWHFPGPAVCASAPGKWWLIGGPGGGDQERSDQEDVWETSTVCVWCPHWVNTRARRIPPRPDNEPSLTWCRCTHILLRGHQTQTVDVSHTFSWSDRPWSPLSMSICIPEMIISMLDNISNSNAHWHYISYAKLHIVDNNSLKIRGRIIHDCIISLKENLV
jgi:hypothetical protein